MKELTAIIVGTDEEQRTILHMQVDATAVAKTIQTFSTLPLGATDIIVRRIQDARPHFILIDISKNEPGPALHAIEVLRAEVPVSAILVVGDTSQPQNIISAMRVGAREFLERPTSTAHLLEAFLRLTSSDRKKKEGAESRGKVSTFINAKGGSGSTTLAVNTAISLQGLCGRVALVDLAPLGHTALQMNVRPAFTIADAMRNVHRLDNALLETYLTRCPSGLQLLAGANTPTTDETTGADLARLFDLLVANFRHVVVDASSRLDRAIRVVCDFSDTVLLVTQSDVTSLWAAAKLQEYIGEGSTNNRLRLVINRFRKIPGFSDVEVEAATQTKLFCKIPNHYAAISAGIDKGTPVSQQNHSDIARAFVGLASQLAEQTPEKKRKAFSLFGAE